MPRSCRSPAMPLRKRLLKATAQRGMGAAGQRHGTCELTSAISRQPVGDLPRFGFFRLTRGHSRRLLTRMLLPFRKCLICSGDDGDNRLYRIVHFYELILKLKPVFLLSSWCVPSMHSSFVCGQQLFQVFNFLNTHSKIFEKICPSFSDVQTECKILLPLRLFEMYYESSIFVLGRIQGEGGGCRAAAPPNPKTELKNRFRRYYYIESFMWFPLQPKSTTEIVTWLYIRILKNTLK
jgi:hypothetical protein